jgi:hypothetical protein
MPISEAQLTELAVKISRETEDSVFRDELIGYSRSVQQLSANCEDLTELSNRCWDSIMKIPDIRVPDGAAQIDRTRIQVEALRRRLLPKLRRLHNALGDFMRDEAFAYLDSTHPMRRLRNFKPAQVIETITTNLLDFARAAGGLLSMDEVMPQLQEYGYKALSSIVGGPGDKAFTSHVGWEVPAVEVGGVKLGPYIGVVRVLREGPTSGDVYGASRHTGGWRSSMPWLMPRSDAKIAFSEKYHFWHTHVNDMGEICFGDQLDRAQRLIKMGQYWALVDLIDMVLESWNPESPHCQLVAFDPAAARENWICPCGRATQGPEPISTSGRPGGTISFHSCITCASDVCSKCVKTCENCGVSPLCNDCQRYVKSASRTYGPYCQECSDRTLSNHPDYVSDEDDPSVKEAKEQEQRKRREDARRRSALEGGNIYDHGIYPPGHDPIIDHSYGAPNLGRLDSPAFQDRVWLLREAGNWICTTPLAG